MFHVKSRLRGEALVSRVPETSGILCRKVMFAHVPSDTKRGAGIHDKWNPLNPPLPEALAPHVMPHKSHQALSHH